MSGYLGQEGRSPYRHFRHDLERLIEPEQADSLLELARLTPGGAAAKFIISAVEEGWRITYPLENGLFHDFDRVVGAHIINRPSDDPVYTAYSELVARSLGFELSGDGK